MVPALRRASPSTRTTDASRTRWTTARIVCSPKQILDLLAASSSRREDLLRFTVLDDRSARDLDASLHEPFDDLLVRQRMRGIFVLDQVLNGVLDRERGVEKDIEANDFLVWQLHV